MPAKLDEISAEGLARKPPLAHVRHLILDARLVLRVPDPSRIGEDMARVRVVAECAIQRRIGLAGALYHRPSLLILDEATSALDVATEAKLLEALRSLTGKLTMVVAAHRLSAVANCDQVVDLAREVPAVAVTAK